MRKISNLRVAIIVGETYYIKHLKLACLEVGADPYYEAMSMELAKDIDSVRRCNAELVIAQLTFRKYGARLIHALADEGIDGFLVTAATRDWEDEHYEGIPLVRPIETKGDFAHDRTIKLLKKGNQFLKDENPYLAKIEAENERFANEQARHAKELETLESGRAVFERRKELAWKRHYVLQSKV